MQDNALTTDEFNLIRDLIHDYSGIALSAEKRHLVQGRLRRRLRHHGLESYRAYYELVRNGGMAGSEAAELINCITTNKTDFYREPHHFEFVANTVIPELAARAESGQALKKLRVWHAGCSTGEEAYTLSIVINEALAGIGKWDVRQLASDIDTAVLAHAERGIYDRDRVAPIPQELLRRYFLRGRGEKRDLFKVRTELAVLIAFRQINLLADPWPIRSDTRFDMIFCRNVVIYFDKPTQRRLFARFEQCLKPGGYLFIGHSETLFGISNSLKPQGKTIYRLPVSQMEGSPAQ